MVKSLLSIFSSFSGKISAADGVISSVSVITEGEAKGHGLLIDRTTLEQVMASAKTYRGGVKVKMDHGSGVQSIVGRLDNFHIEGNQLFADLHLLKSHSDFGFIIELAQTIPDTFGISIAFSGVAEKKGDSYFARCTELYSADIVSEPAANPKGLFEQPKQVDSGEKSMTPEQFQAALKEALAPLQAKIEALEKPATPPAPVEKTKEQEKEEMAAVVSAAVVREMAKLGTQAAPAAPAVPTPAPAPKPSTFEEFVAEKIKGGMSKTDAIRFCVANHQEEHASAVLRGIKTL